MLFLLNFYYLDKPKSQREIDDDYFKKEILRVFVNNRSVYGVRRLHAQLKREGISIGRDRVSRLMRELSISGVSRDKKLNPQVTSSSKDAKYPEDRVNRKFYANAPNKLWVSDITYVRTLLGFCYVALITDVFSNTIVGFMVSTKCDKKLVLDALFMAIARRGPGVQLVHHSDRGSQYFSLRYMETLEENLIIQSTGRTGNSYDNATSESINSRFKAELIYNKKGVVKWTSYLVVATETSKYVYWWNNERLQERLGFLTPKEFEENYYKSPTTAA